MTEQLEAKVRAFADADWTGVRAILQPIFRAGETYAVPAAVSEQDAHRKWTGSPKAVFVAEDTRNGEIVGTYYLKPNYDGPGTHVCNCGYAVATESGDRGTASLMCGHSQGEAVSHGFRAMQFNLAAASNDGRFDSGPGSASRAWHPARCVPASEPWLRRRLRDVQVVGVGRLTERLNEPTGLARPGAGTRRIAAQQAVQRTNRSSRELTSVAVWRHTSRKGRFRSALVLAVGRRSDRRRKHSVRTAANALVAFVAVEHLAFLVLEMFLWNTPVGIRVFDLTPEFAEQSASLAANQGLYNGFLAAGLVWSLLRGSSGFPEKVFFLSCVIVAGVFGALTAKGSILFIQAAPALITLVLVVLSREKPGGSEGAA